MKSQSNQLNTSNPRYSKFCAYLLAGTTLLVAGQSWAARSYLYINPTNSVYDPDSRVWIESATDPVSFSGNATQANAYAGTGELKIKSQVAQTTGGFFNKTGRAQAGFYNNVGVGAGSSGLNVGDTVTLSLSLSLDGRLETSVHHPSTEYTDDGGGANTTARLIDTSFFFVLDKTPYDNGEGGISFNTSTAVEFQPKADLGLNGSFPASPTDPRWEYMLNQGWGWTLTNNLGDNQSAGLPLDPYDPEIYYCTDGDPGGCPSSRFLDFSTGQLEIDFQTSIGNTLGLSGMLEVLAHGINGGSAVGEQRFFQYLQCRDHRSV